MYNALTKRCFDACCVDFTGRVLKHKEVGCDMANAVATRLRPLRPFPCDVSSLCCGKAAM